LQIVLHVADVDVLLGVVLLHDDHLLPGHDIPDVTLDIRKLPQLHTVTDL